MPTVTGTPFDGSSAQTALAVVLNALNANTEIILGGQSVVAFNVASVSGTWTLSFQYTIDNINWFALSVMPVPNGTSPAAAMVTSTTGAAGAGEWRADVQGYYAVRAIMTAFTSGAATVSAVAVPAQNIAHVLTDGVNGPVQVAQAATNVKTLNIVNTENQRLSYTNTVEFGANATNPTDVWLITGSATKVVRITRLEIWGYEGTTGVSAEYILLIKRSAANTGGTSTNNTAGTVPHDSNNAASTVGSILSYTANPSALGAAVGTVRAPIPTFPSTGLITPVIYDFGTRNDQPIVLRGVAQSLAINLNAQALLSGTILSISVDWTEDAT